MVGLWRGVVCPCTPVREDVVTLRDLFSSITLTFVVDVAAKNKILLLERLLHLILTECQLLLRFNRHWLESFLSMTGE